MPFYAILSSVANMTKIIHAITPVANIAASTEFVEIQNQVLICMSKAGIEKNRQILRTNIANCRGTKEI